MSQLMIILDGFLNTSEGLMVLIDLTLLALYLTRERNMSINHYCGRCHHTHSFELVRMTEAGGVYRGFCASEIVVLNEGSVRLAKEK